MKKYQKLFKSLSRNKNRKVWDQKTKFGAPHKPFLLFSVIDQIEVGNIESPFVPLSQDIIDDFMIYWDGIMDNNQKTSIAKPFFHMDSEPFWSLVYENPNKKYKGYSYTPSLFSLQNKITGANLDSDLFSELQQDDVRNVYRQLLLETYFDPSTKNKILDISRFNLMSYPYAENLKAMAAEPFEAYHIDKFKNRKTHIPGWIQNRDYPFSRVVRKNYQHKCAICRSKVLTEDGRSLVEGAHIIPWRESQNDDPRNGLALCPSHHWMFDQYLITVDENYKIIIHNKLAKIGEQIENTLKWNHEELFLPSNQKYRPASKALESHYSIFKNNKH
ncbi:MAG TPA: HNH endonuclease [Balneolaceae bacterium]|nr:HNH endonuclease [Balneolaceae bacterium]